MESRKVTLDEHCGKTDADFSSRRCFLNHVENHSENKFKCKICDPVWKNGPENEFNYWVRKVGTEAEGDGLFRAVVHTNAYNL